MRIPHANRTLTLVVSIILCFSIAAHASAKGDFLTLILTGTDPNGFWLNPVWKYQPAELLDAAKACNGFPRGSNPVAACSKDNVAIDAPEYIGLVQRIFAWTCTHFENPGLSADSVFGHVNWRPVTMTGDLYFADYQFEFPGSILYSTLPGDGDYDFFLRRHDQSVYLSGNSTPANPGITVEFSERETLRHVQHGWWQEFRRRVFRDRDFSYAADMLADSSGEQDVVIGLLGIDTKHVPHTELHPAYALAARIRDGQGVGWAIFARNWGSEGGCSSQPHDLKSLKNGRLIISLPLGSTSQKTKIDFGRTHLYGDKTALPWGARVLDQALVVTVKLPNPSKRAFVYGEIRMCSADCTAPEPQASDELPFDPEIVPPGSHAAGNTYISRKTRM